MVAVEQVARARLYGEALPPFFFVLLVILGRRYAHVEHAEGGVVVGGHGNGETQAHVGHGGVAGEGAQGLQVGRDDKVAEVVPGTNGHARHYLAVAEFQGAVETEGEVGEPARVLGALDLLLSGDDVFHGIGVYAHGSVGIVKALGVASLAAGTHGGGGAVEDGCDVFGDDGTVFVLPYDGVIACAFDGEVEHDVVAHAVHPNVEYVDCAFGASPCVHVFVGAHLDVAVAPVGRHEDVAAGVPHVLREGDEDVLFVVAVDARCLDVGHKQVFVGCGGVIFFVEERDEEIFEELATQFFEVVGAAFRGVHGAGKEQ